MDTLDSPPGVTAHDLVDLYDADGIARALSGELRTTLALFFHERDRQLALTTVHAVETTGAGQPMVGPGRPLAYEDEQQILALLSGRADASAIEILPPNVLYADPSTLLWWLPPQVRPMYLQSHAAGARVIRTRWPALVALVRERRLHLAAVIGDARPDGQSALFHAPVGNVHGNTEVCTGNAVLPAGPAPSLLQGWQAVITDTAFTHVNHRETLRASTKPARRSRARRFVDADADFWIARDGCDEALPEDQLNPLGFPLAEWLPRLRAAQRRGDVL